MEMCLSISLPYARAPCRLRFPTAVAPLHSQSTEMVGKFGKWKKFPYKDTKKSSLIRLTINNSLFISKNLYFTLFPRKKMFFFFSILQTTKLNLRWPTTLQQPWTNWLAPTMWTLVNAKTGLNNFRDPKPLSTTWTCNSKCSRETKTNNFDWHKTWQWERQTLISLFYWGTS